VSPLVSVLTNDRPAQIGPVMELLRAAAQTAGVELALDPVQVEGHGPPDAESVDIDDPRADEAALCIALGGDGTILRALRRYAGSGVPVFAVNFGEIGFLATIEPDEAQEWLDRALATDFEVVKLPVLVFSTGRESFAAVNDVAIMRKPGDRVTRLSYAVGGEEIGSVRADGIVAATPVGSTGYNLANGGPILAWGVEGFAVSFVAPHSLTARALVVAPGDALEICNQSDSATEIFVDGRPAGEFSAQDSLTVRFADQAAVLAQKPGSSFYHRLRERFGRLA
jgi:NAD+ kinase